MSTSVGDASPDPLLALGQRVTRLGQDVEKITRESAAAATACGEKVAALRQEVMDLTDLVAELADKLADLDAGGDDPAAPAVTARSWFELDADQAAVALGQLDPWVRTVLLRQRDVAVHLFPCWWRHPVVVDDLLGLYAAWCAAYRDPDAPATACVEWYDRHLAGFARRLADTARAYIGKCGPDKHHGPDGAEFTNAAWAPLTDEVRAGWARSWTSTREAYPPATATMTNPSAAQPTTRSSNGSGPWLAPGTLI